MFYSIVTNIMRFSFLFPCPFDQGKAPRMVQPKFPPITRGALERFVLS